MQTAKQTEKQRERERERERDRQTDRQTPIHRQTVRNRDRKDRQRDRETERQRDRYIDKQAYRQIDNSSGGRAIGVNAVTSEVSRVVEPMIGWVVVILEGFTVLGPSHMEIAANHCPIAAKA